MKISQIAFVLSLAVSLCGCSVALQSQARDQLRAQCAAKGMQFVETDTKTTELVVVSSAQVSGECVSPSDPRWVGPKPAASPVPSKQT